ncbi:MAG: tetratricopeptide repeat protein [Bacteroidetes bacterium]|nr:tetratricopeptide repeat protein [Bacteroidota bacterium]
MKSLYVAILLAVIAIAILFFGFSNKPPVRSAFDEQREKLIDSLNYPNSAQLEDMHSDMLKSSQGSKGALIQQLSDEWLQLGQPAIAADYLRQKADNDPSYENFMRAGSALSSLIDFVQEENLRASVVYGARYCFEEATQLQPDDLDAKIGLATVLVSGTNAPMEGIMMLREIDAAHPDNPKVNLELGRFSVMSGQMDKALERFDKVLQKDSLNLQARYMKAQTYLGLKDTSAAILELERLKSMTTDSMIVNQVQAEIHNLNH